jgi:hypothetical protein
MSEGERPETINSYLISLSDTIFKENHLGSNDFAPQPVPDFQSFSPRALLCNVRDGLMSLLQFKLNFSNHSDYLNSENTKLETCTQNCEVQVRKHLRAQYELRVSLQERKWKLEDLESNEENYRKKTEVLEKQIEILKVPKKFDEKKIRVEMEKKLEELKKNLEKQDENFEILQKINLDLKNQLEEKTFEFGILKKEKRRIENLALVLKTSPEKGSVDELQPNPECSIFLSPLIEKSERRKSELQPRHKRSSTGDFDFNQVIENWMSPDPVFVKQEGNKMPVKVPRRNLFHKRTYSKVDDSIFK